VTQTGWIIVGWLGSIPIALVVGYVAGIYEDKPSLPMVLGLILIAPVMAMLGLIVLAFSLVAGAFMLLFSPYYLFEAWNNRREHPRPPDTEPFYQGIYDGSRHLPKESGDPEYLRGNRYYG
jgi:hypothetical protein